MSATQRKASGRARLLPSRGSRAGRGSAGASPSRGTKSKTPAADDKEVQFSNLDKVLYPEAGFTKGQVIDYYLRIAPALLPHLSGRPLTLKRYPNGVDQMFFYEKRCPVHRPAWVSTGKVWSEGNNDYINYCVVEDKPTLAWLANIACLEMHTLLSRLPDTNSPTSMVFDLDPGPPADILDSIRVGLKMRDVLAKLGLKSFAKTSGSKGLHLWVPLNTPVTFERTKQFAHAMALMFEREHPKEALSVMKRDLRKGKVFIDWSQNDEHKTTACVYTMRARSQPTVSCPVTWEELEQTLQKRAPNQLTFKTDDVLARVKEKGDLFAPVLKLKQKLPD